MRGLKQNKNFQLLALEVVAVTYKRWLLTRGSKYSDLNGVLENWSLRRGGGLREVMVASGGSTVFHYCSCTSDNVITPNLHHKKRQHL